MKMKMQEIRDLSDEDLLSKHVEFKKDLFAMNIERQMKRAEKPSKFGLLRRNIARVLTVINEPKNKSHGTKTQ